MIDLKAYVSTLNGKPAAVYGLGLSGMAAVRALVAAGVSVRAWDDDAGKRETAAKAGAQIDDLSGDLSNFAFLLLSPGIPLHFPAPHPVVARARAAGTEIIGDIELLHRAGHGLKTIGVTGTNGKSTTTALIGHILNDAGMHVAVGGNIGKAALDLNLSGADAVVLELSSYQLDLCPDFAPDIAVHLNLTPDHLDRHGDVEGYKTAKMRIFRGAGQAVIGVDDAPSQAMLHSVEKSGMRAVYAISASAPVARGAYVRDGILFDAMGAQPAEIGDLRAMKTLPGVHNHQNAAAAYAACRLMEARAEAIMAAMRRYPGLPHRMHLVRVINGVSYVNDSKATNADAAAKALACYRNIYWILGGKPKDGGLDGLEPLLERVSHAFVIGAAAPDFSRWLARRGVPLTQCDTMARAVPEAHRLAQAGRGQPGGAGVVMLSPACASFDQFRSFEHRGDVFTDLVKALPEGQEGAGK